MITQKGEKEPLKIELTDSQTSIIELRDAINKKRRQRFCHYCKSSRWR
ncbi:hypothetical protein IC611_15630 [Proteus mirabilis]